MQLGEFPRTPGLFIFNYQHQAACGQVSGAVVLPPPRPTLPRCPHTGSMQCVAVQGPGHSNTHTKIQKYIEIEIYKYRVDQKKGRSQNIIVFHELLSLGCINLKNLCAHHQEEILRFQKHPQLVKFRCRLLNVVSCCCEGSHVSFSSHSVVQRQHTIARKQQV